MKCTCKQCGKEFTLTDSEINFYEIRNLSLPKRCEDCRKKNKQEQDSNSKETQNKSEGTKSKKGNTLLKSIITLILTLVLGTTAWNGIQENASNDNLPNNNQTIGAEDTSYLNFDGTNTGDTSNSIQSNMSQNSSPSDEQITSQENSEDDNSEDNQITIENNNSTSTTENKDTSSDEEITLTFRNKKLLDSHYEKHGKEMGFASAKEYEKAAAKVVTNKEALHKIEAEDGDDVYYIESTNEFVIVSKDGYLRTYFYPSDGLDYYNRQ